MLKSSTNLAFIFALLSLMIHVKSQENLPIGYISYYNNDAKNDQFLNSLTLCNPEYWNLSKDKSGTVISPLSSDSLGLLQPHGNLGMLKDMIFGEFIMEFEFMPGPTDTNAISGFSFICPAKTSDIFYATLLTADTIYFYYYNKNVSERLDALPLNIKPGAWNHVKVTRDILKRSLTFVVNKDEAGKAMFSDPRLVMGFVGFSTIGTRSVIRKIRLWAPTTITETFKCPEIVNKP